MAALQRLRPEVKRLVHVPEKVNQGFERVLDPARYVVVVGVPSRPARCLQVLQCVRGVHNPVEDVDVGLATLGHLNRESAD